MATRVNGLRLYLDTTTFEITDDDGRAYTVEEARTACDAGKLADCNLAFNRLIRNRFDIEACRQFYAENP